jgi:hypothetical protein
VIDRELVVEAPVLSVTLALKVYEPIAVGVPETIPAELRSMPFGRKPETKVHV